MKTSASSSPTNALLQWAEKLMGPGGVMTLNEIIPLMLQGGKPSEAAGPPVVIRTMSKWLRSPRARAAVPRCGPCSPASQSSSSHSDKRRFQAAVLSQVLWSWSLCLFPKQFYRSAWQTPEIQWSPQPGTAGLGKISDANPSHLGLINKLECSQEQGLYLTHLCVSELRGGLSDHRSSVTIGWTHARTEFLKHRQGIE